MESICGILLFLFTSGGIRVGGDFSLVPELKGTDDGEEDGYFVALVDPRFLYNTNFHDI